MCGIAGFFDIDVRPRRADASDLLLSQIDACRYRGPDAKGAWEAPGVGLGHARLAIIDLSESANQPMFSADRQVAAAFNGEIYNFQDVRRELEAKGHAFRTNSDTEVIVEGYRAWGTDVVHRLRGMFAIALFDTAQDQLVLIRDRVGKKPLCYGVFDGTLVFGSEIKSILRWPGVPRRPNLDALDQYLTFQYVPAPLTAFEGVFKLPPAHMLVARRGGAPKIARYFELPKPNAAKHRPEPQLVEELLHHLREATRLRMISDVPLGAFLSGGVDSSSVVAMMALESGRPVKTFTIGFEEEAYDERPFARAVAQRYATDHHEFVVRPRALEVLDDLVFHYGEPFADSSAIPTYYLSKLARQHVTVALNGDGADESFLGYVRYLNCRRLERIHRALPEWVARPLLRLTRALPRTADRVAFVRRARQALARRADRPSRRYEQFIAYFPDEAKRPLYAGDMTAYLDRSALDRLDHYFDEGPTMAMGAGWADIHSYLPDDLLVKVDIASMANSLEARSPFLDHELMSWAATIPEDQRFNGDEPKGLLKTAMEPFLPRELLYRPKMGFAVPIDLWLRGEIKGFARDTLLGRAARERGLFRQEEVESMLDRHARGENLAPRLWALLMLELWFEMWIDPANPPLGAVAGRLAGRPAGLLPA
jgi:asparagine synthase (glutamine-hydrolysing)